MGKDDLAIGNGFTFCFYSSFLDRFFDRYIDIALWLVVKLYRLVLAVNQFLLVF